MCLQMYAASKSASMLPGQDTSTYIDVLKTVLKSQIEHLVGPFLIEFKRVVYELVLLVNKSKK